MTKQTEALKLALEVYMAAGFGNSTDFALQRKAYDLALQALALVNEVDQEQPAQPQQKPMAWIHICRKRPELRVLSFEEENPALKAKGYKAYPLTSPPTLSLAQRQELRADTWRD